MHRKRKSRALCFPEIGKIDNLSLKELYDEICGYMTSDDVVVYESLPFWEIRISNGEKTMILTSYDFNSHVLVKRKSGEVLISTSYYFKKAVKMFES